MNNKELLIRLISLNDFIEELDNKKVCGHSIGVYKVISGFLMDIIEELEKENKND